MIAGLSIALIVYMIELLINRNLNHPKGTPVIPHWEYCFVPIAFVIGFIFSRCWMIHITMKDKTLG